MGDFLKKDVETPLCGHYLAAGIRLKIETNSESILSIARANLEQQDNDPETADDVRLRLWVEAESSPEPPKPYFRGLGHLVFSGYDERSSLLINLRDRRGAGRLTRTLAENASYWKSVLLPSLLSIIAPTAGLTSFHSACVGWKGSGLLLFGHSGAGKSSLSFALTRTGLDFLSDDRTLVGRHGGMLTAWGLPGEMKQRADAVLYFPELRALEQRAGWDGDSAFRFDPGELAGIHRVRSCEPRWIVFLERQLDPVFSLEEISVEESARLLQRDLHEESPEAAASRNITIDALSRRPGYRLRYGGNPHTVAGALHDFFLKNGYGKAPLSRSRETDFASARVARTPAPSSDPLRRFRATCLHSDVLLMGRQLRIETDSPLILKRISEVFHSFEPPAAPFPQFLWRIVSEPGKKDSAWPFRGGFSNGSLRYMNLGQRGFVAADLAVREAVGVLPEPLCEDDIGFSTVFLASLLHITAPALGLTPVSAACVARGSNGLLLFGPPDSGKTTASYWGRKLGLEFHADQATFLEHDAGAIHAWGDFWPAAFRPESAQYLPDLSAAARSFIYRGRTFLCIDKAPLPAAKPRRVVPAACIFLERQKASPPRLIRLRRNEVAQQIFAEAGADEDQGAILALLGRMPAYRLLYDEDPYVAALFFRSVLDAHELMEQRA